MSNVRNALARREEATTEAAKAPTLATVIRTTIEKQSSAFQAVLPHRSDPERFARLVITAVKSTPKLMECFGTDQGVTSVLIAAMQAATVGLEVNTPAQEAWLIPRKNRGVMEAQLQIGYRGVKKLARRSGTVKTIFAEVVREGDHFRYERGLEADVLEHRPAEGSDRELTHAYAVVRYRPDGYNFVVLDRDQVHKRRAASMSWNHKPADSPWETWTEEMWRKSAIHALKSDLDLSPEALNALDTEGRALAWDDEAGVIAAGDYAELEAGEDNGTEADTSTNVLDVTEAEAG